MQALKMFTGGGGGGGGGQGGHGGGGYGHEGGGGMGGGQNAFIEMAMKQASGLFDAQHAQGNVEPGADKQSVVNNAAKMAFKMYVKSQGGGGGGGGGPGGLMGLAGKFL